MTSPASLSVSKNSLCNGQEQDLLHPNLIIPSFKQDAGLINSNKKSKKVIEQMRFEQKMKVINDKMGSYKRSTNNCHKKYIGILKNLLFLKLDNKIKEYILSEFNQYRNSRVYFFIILAYVKWYLNVSDICWIYKHFCEQMRSKIDRYRLEISTTKNANFIHFRSDQITEMVFSIQAINFYLRGNISESVCTLYKKNKPSIIKKNQYLRTTQILEEVERELSDKFYGIDMKGKINQIKLWELLDQDKTLNNCLRQFGSNIGSEGENILSKRQKKNIKNEKVNIDEYSFQNSQQDSNQIDEDQHCSISQQEELQNNQKRNMDFHQISNKYPLISLQESYQIVSADVWQNWLIQRQRRLNFALKYKQQMQAREKLQCLPKTNIL